MEQLTTVTFGSHIDAIPPYLLMACKKLASVVIPGNVKTIGNEAFMNCGAPVFNNRLFAWLPPSYEGEYTIPEGIEEICDKAFYIASISGIHLPSSLKRIGADAFSWASNIKNVELPDNIEFISKGAFTSNVKFYAHRGTSSLLALWSAFSTSFNKCTVYDIGTDAILEAPSINYPSVTQTTAKAAIRNMYEEYTYTSGDGATITDDKIELKGLFPETTDSLRLTVTKGNAKYYTAAKSTNTSYFEPTVHTYYKVSVDGNAATVTGYAMRGSDNTAKQGFKYWKEVNAARSMAPAVPADAQTVEASGQLMTAMLTGLDYESSYCFVAFVTTTEGETFYGEQQTFLTGKDTSGVDDALVNDTPVETGRYDLNGRRLNSRQRGLNIIRMNDGTTHKVLVK